VIDGGSGTDTAEIDLAAATANLAVQLSNLPLPGISSGTRPVSPVVLTSIEALVVTTGSGDDTVTGGARADRITTGAGNDRVNSGIGADTVSLGDGNDLLTDLGGNGDVIDAGRGNDRVTIGGQVASVNGGEGTDRITADLFASTSGLTLTLTLGGTVNLPVRGWGLRGFEQYFLTFGAGSDTIRADYGLHRLDGGAGIDMLTVLADDLVTFTTSTSGGVTTWTFASGMVATGFETVTITYRPRTLTGTDANDVLTGGLGDDQLSGGLGTDRLTGGDGADSFLIDLFPSRFSGPDTITDFRPGEDRITLDSSVFTALASFAGGALPLDELGSSGDARLLYDAANGELSYDADGSDGSGPVMIATLLGGPALEVADIMVI
jgi:Ca2+-binding RTX toxin-like protein